VRRRRCLECGHARASAEDQARAAGIVRAEHESDERLAARARIVFEFEAHRGASSEEIELCVLRPIPRPLRAGYRQTLRGAVSGDVWVTRFVVKDFAGHFLIHSAKVGTVTEPFGRAAELSWPGAGQLAGGMCFSVDVEALNTCHVAVAVFARRLKGSSALGYQQDPETGSYVVR
jgi:hypothetical protein